jgi:hypothetical protein
MTVVPISDVTDSKPCSGPGCQELVARGARGFAAYCDRCRPARIEEMVANRRAVLAGEKPPARQRPPKTGDESLAVLERKVARLRVEAQKHLNEYKAAKAQLAAAYDEEIASLQRRKEAL